MQGARRFVFSGLFLLAAALVSAASSSARAAEGLPLADMIRETKVALLRVQDAAEARNLPPLANAVLELSTIQEVDASGSLKLVVVEIGGGPATEATSSISVTLVPPPAGSPSDIASVRLADQLAQSILSAARALAEAKAGNPPLIAGEVKASIKFALVRAANGGLSLTFPPFEVSAGAKVKASEIQTITVTYATKKEN
jgi:hypothetical protein